MTLTLTRIRGPGFALTAVTAAFSAMLLSANLATPLYAVWAKQFGFSTALLALIFAVYALVLIPALLLFGQLSDRLGRRPVIGIGLWFVPETAERQPGGLRIRRPHVPREIRGAFIRVGLTGAAVWAVAGLFLSVMPSYAGQLVLHSRNLALLALVAALILVMSCATQLALRRGAPPAQAQAAGLALLAAGLLALVLAAPAQSAALLIVGAILAGAGHGAAVLAAQDDLTRLAPGGQRAEVSAAFYVCVYLGVAVPAIGIGVLAVATTLFTAVTTFAAVTGALALTVAAWHLRDRGQPPAMEDREKSLVPGHAAS